MRRSQPCRTEVTCGASLVETCLRPAEGSREVGALLGRDRPVLITADAIPLDLGAVLEQQDQLAARVSGLQAYLAALGTFGREWIEVAQSVPAIGRGDREQIIGERRTGDQHQTRVIAGHLIDLGVPVVRHSGHAGGAPAEREQPLAQ